MPDITKRLEKAEKYLQRGKLDAALEEYLGALQDDPPNERVREAAADLCISLNRNGEAASLLNVIFDHAASTGDAAKGIATYKKLTRLATPAVEQTFRFAQLIEKSNRREALEAYETALQGFTHARSPQAALQALKCIVALEPSAENLRRQGELAAQVGDNKTAAASFLQAGDLERGSGAPAISWYERAHSLDPHNAAAALAYGRALLARGESQAAIKILDSFANCSQAVPDAREVYGRALMLAGRFEDALPFLWELFERDPKEIGAIVHVIESMIDSVQYEKALDLTHKLEYHELKAGRRREFISLIKEIGEQRSLDVEFLEYMVELFNASNREHDYCETLLKLFELYYADGNFLKAADCLDRAAEVDAYEAGHQNRMEMLRGKIDAQRFNSIANRLSSVLRVDEAKDESPEAAFEKEGTVLEDLMLQAEIFLQYSMRSKAVERLERIVKLFPGEESKNDELHQLFLSAGFEPQYERPAPSRAAAAPAAAPHVPQAVADEAAVDNISRVTEITRNIYRQGSVKGVLFASVNDIGRHWNASRCVAGLCTPGKPPSAALEYCAPGVKQSDVMGIVKLITTLQTIAVQRGAISVSHALAIPELARVQSVISTLDIRSLLAVPLSDGDEHVGILILEQCGTSRTWRQTDLVVLKTIADQMVLAVNNAKLRSLVKTLAVTDEKSGLLKRSSYLDVLLSEVKRSLQQNSTVTVMLMHFGKASTLVREVGEQAVETTMQEIGQVICSHIRQNDVAVRYDLTSLALILADTTDKNAFFVVDKLRKVLVSVRVPGRKQPLPVTIGIAEAVMQHRFDPVDIVTEVINRAEAALEAARAEGGNKAHSLAPALGTATAFTAD